MVSIHVKSEKVQEGKAEGKGKGRYHFEPSVINHSSLAGGKGGGKRKGKAKGKGKFSGKMSFMTNPRGSDGNIMKCHECNSEDHLIASCPKKKGGIGKSKGKGKRFMTETAQPSLVAFQSGALQGIVNGSSDQWFIGNTTATIEEVYDDLDD